jgi:hypothetical protein
VAVEDLGVVQISYDLIITSDRYGEMWEEVMVTVTKFSWSVK